MRAGGLIGWGLAFREMVLSGFGRPDSLVGLIGWVLCAAATRLRGSDARWAVPGSATLG